MRKKTIKKIIKKTNKKMMKKRRNKINRRWNKSAFNITEIQQLTAKDLYVKT